MRIVLENFKCWSKNEFHFENGRINLLDGPSGRGKSSILEALAFAITGEGKNIKSYQAKTAKVTVEYNSLKIVRTKTPNSLYVKHGDKEYHDDVAQSIIDKHFTKYFSNVSYISQNARNSFFKMTPAEKLAFIETFALDIGDKKEKVHELVSNRKEVLKECTTKLQTTEEVFKKMMVPKDMPFPVRGKEDDIVSTIKKYRKLEEKLSSEICELEQEIETQEKNYKIYTELEKKKEHSFDKYTRSQTRLKEIGAKKEACTFDETRLGEYGEILKRKQAIQAQYTTKEEIERLERDVQTYAHELESVWKEMSKEEFVETIQALEEYVSTQRSVRSKRETLRDLESKLSTITETEIEEKEKEIQTLRDSYDLLQKMKQVYKCPSCSASLRVCSDRIELFTTRVSTTETESSLLKKIKADELALKEMKRQWVETNKVRAQIEHISSEIFRLKESYETLDDDVSDDLKGYKTQKKEAETKEVQLRAHLDKSTKRLETLQSKFVELEDTDERTLEDIQALYIQEQTNQTIYKTYQRDYDQAEKEMRMYKSEYDTVCLSLLDIVYDDPSDKKETVKKYKEKYEKVRKTNEQIREWVANEEIREAYDDVSESLVSLREHEQHSQTKYKNALALKEAILVAESLYFQHFIRAFNQTLKMYLDLFFVDDPITLYIDTFKTGKQAKPQIDIKVFYKANETDMTCLSGGEQDRVNLAFTLAFSDMYKGSVLLLDECISSLDTENYVNVMEVLNEKVKHKTIILISHQANEGLFDTIITI
jgi:DNA repair exonuclease SbcCD ATPase subunit